MSEKLTQEPGVLPESEAEKEPTLSLEEVDKLFRERPELIEEMKKVFSVSLRCSFAADYEGRSVRQWRRVMRIFSPVCLCRLNCVN